MSRLKNRLAALVVIALPLACASQPPPKPAPVVDDVPPQATPYDASIAIKAVGTEGYNVADLTAVVRDAIARTSGLLAIDELTLKAVLAACEAPPCDDDTLTRYQHAELVVTSAVARIGDHDRASIVVTQGMREAARADAVAPDAPRALTRAAYEAGRLLRMRIERGDIELRGLQVRRERAESHIGPNRSGPHGAGETRGGSMAGSM
jgi:hypothetical protein